MRAESPPLALLAKAISSPWLRQAKRALAQAGTKKSLHSALAALSHVHACDASQRPRAVVRIVFRIVRFDQTCEHTYLSQELSINMALHVLGTSGACDSGFLSVCVDCALVFHLDVWLCMHVICACVSLRLCGGSWCCVQFEDDDDAVDLPAGHMIDAAEVEVCMQMRGRFCCIS